MSSASSAVVDALPTVLSAVLALSALLTLAVGYRVIRGPTTPDRVVALDVVGTNVVAIALVFAVLRAAQYDTASGGFFVDVSLVLAIIGFISTVTVARYVTEGDIIE